MEADLAVRGIILKNLSLHRRTSSHNRRTNDDAKAGPWLLKIKFCGKIWVSLMFAMSSTTQK